MRLDIRRLAVVRPLAFLALLGLVLVSGCGSEDCEGGSTDPNSDCYTPPEE